MFRPGIARLLTPHARVAVARMSSSPAAKKMKSTKVIGTHSGTFHCDGERG